MPNSCIRLNREADLALENFKLQARQTTHKKIYKKDIANFLILELTKHPDCKKKLFKWIKGQR